MSNEKEYIGDDFKRYMKSVKDIPLINCKEEKRLSSIILNSEDQEEIDKAVNKLVISNLRLVVKFAINYYKFIAKGSFGISMMDLIAEGNVALLRAAKTFDASLSRFSTYSTYYIKRAFQNHKMQASFIKFPTSHATIINAVKRVSTENRDLTQEEKTEIAKKAKCTLEQIEFVIECEKSKVVSIDKVSLADDSSILYNYHDSDSDLEASDSMMSKETKEYLLEKIDTLTPPEKEVVMAKFFSDEDITLVKIAIERGVSKQSISSILKKAIKKLKAKIIFDRHIDDQNNP